MQIPFTQKLHVARERIVADPVLRWVVIAAISLLLLTVILGALAGYHQARSSALSGELVQKNAALEQVSDEAAALRRKVEQYEPVYLQSKRLDDREATVTAREAAVSDRESKADATKASLDTREAAVQDRERKAAENANATDWWVPQVRECLSRSGDNRVATVTEGRLLGRDTTCYTQ